MASEGIHEYAKHDLYLIAFGFSDPITRKPRSQIFFHILPCTQKRPNVIALKSQWNRLFVMVNLIVPKGCAV